METVNKKVLVKSLADKLDITSKQAGQFVDAMISEIVDSLEKGDVVDLSGLGKFEIRERAARMGVNPHTKEAMEIPASRYIKFTAKKAVNARMNPDTEDKA